MTTSNDNDSGLPEVKTTREEFQDLWETIVNKGINNYETLSREERIWFNLEPLLELGLIDHYVNSGAEHNSDTIEDLRYINQDVFADLMIKFNSAFRGGGVPLDINERNDQLGDDFEDQFVDEIDEKAWALYKEFDLALLALIVRSFN